MAGGANTVAPPVHLPAGLFRFLSFAMKSVDRLIFRELFGPFWNSVFMFLSVLFATAYLFKFTELLTQGMPVGIVGKMVVY